ncbi:Fasciculation and elongation protein zeta-2, partial [Eschrichtius robustus]|nr:Fasciculation and elongation protein zeta-2 [Eschrichtius robustus]
MKRGKEREKLPEPGESSYGGESPVSVYQCVNPPGSQKSRASFDVAHKDDEELREQLDMHSIIVSCVNDEPLFTADQERRVKRLSVSELNELLEEIETAIKEYSEELVQQLALRDELEFEKEVKNSFISVLIEVQNKQKEHKETAKKKKKLKNSSSQNGKNERSHLPGTVSDVLQVTSHTGNGFGGHSSASDQQRRAGPMHTGVRGASHQRAKGILFKNATVLCSFRKVFSW